MTVSTTVSTAPRDLTEREILWRDAWQTARDVNLSAIDNREPGAPGYESVRRLLGEQFPTGNLARDLLGAWRDGQIGLRVVVVGRDKDGVFEDEDGACIRGFDKDTERPAYRLRITTGLLDAQPLPARIAAREAADAATDQW